MQVFDTTDEIGIDLIRSLYRIRRVEESIAERYAEQEMRCPVHLSIGQEAVAVGVCSQLTHDDYAVSTHRAHAHYLAKGGSLKRMLAEIYGRETGCCKGRGGSMHLVDQEVGFLWSAPILGGSIPVGVGTAFGAKLKGEERLVVIFLGEGSTEEGSFAESLNFAALHSLPILFVVENNLYSVMSPIEVRQPKSRDLCKIAEGHGVHALRGEGNDLEEVISLTKQLTHYIRENGVPALVELSTYRYREHCGPNDDPFQPEEEKAFWLSKDPLKGIELPLDDQKEIEQEIEEAFAFAKESGYEKV